ncbi:Uncharacterised protein [Zhongshania aliphaticivorans]|uniref:DUF676 domain-containing protein n=1 Tax=Zhongshania aliphaticivorans TaxID=1470434 RepID=A0A5S9MUK3_9GAMM|nr:Uncharacterised protein [Zhongshania aliphaticivorans]CAA0085416.1 Uncharacterised protein [Zhongshania aliphaticivorans]
MFWPDLLKADPRFNKPSIYLAEFYTSIKSNDYGIKNCATEVFSALSRTCNNNHPAPIEKTNIIFVGHSTGGIIARYIIEANSDAFIGKKIGLCLYASPSYGSKLSNSLGWLASLFNNKLAKELSWGSSILDDLDDRFLTLLESKQIDISGMEAYENKAPFKIPFSRKRVVPKISAARYFSKRVLVPNTDHSSISKPTSTDSLSHQYLFDFCKHSDLLTSNRTGLISRDSLFDRYEPKYENYYIEREADIELSNQIKNYSIWVCGESGTGKTASITRMFSLQKQTPQFISLGRYIDHSPESLIQETYIEISNKQDLGKVIGVNECLSRIINEINYLTRESTYLLFIEEIPITDQEMFSKFSNFIYIIISSIEKQKNFRIVLSSIYKPNIDLDPELIKTFERFKILEWNRWNEKDIDRLIMTISKDLNLNENPLTAADFNGTPRSVKNKFRELISRVR